MPRLQLVGVVFCASMSLVLPAVGAPNGAGGVQTLVPTDGGVPVPSGALVPVAAPSTTAPGFSAKVALGKGLTVSRGDALSMTIKGRVSVRDVVVMNGNNVTNELSLRTVRLGVQGKMLSPAISYYVQLALGTADYETLKDSTGKETLVTSPVYDAYVDFTAWRDLQLRVGQFFVPLDRSRTIREFSLQFVDRQQMITELNLERDMGLLISSNDFLGWGGRLAYALGVYGGQGKNRALPVTNPGFLWVGRLTVRPMGPFDDDVEGDVERSSSPHLAVGVGAAYNGNTWRQRSTLGTVLTLGGVDYLHLAGDVVFKYGGFAFLGEVLYRKAPHDVRSNGTLTEYTRSAWGYTVQASYLFTKELELAARWDQLRPLGQTDPKLIEFTLQQGRELTVGFNVYFNGHLLKLQFDYTARFSEAGSLASHLARALVDVSL